MPQGQQIKSLLKTEVCLVLALVLSNYWALEHLDLPPGRIKKKKMHKYFDFKKGTL